MGNLSAAVKISRKNFYERNLRAGMEYTGCIPYVTYTLLKDFMTGLPSRRFQREKERKKGKEAKKKKKRSRTFVEKMMYLHCYREACEETLTSFTICGAGKDKGKCFRFANPSLVHSTMFLKMLRFVFRIIDRGVSGIRFLTQIVVASNE